MKKIYMSFFGLVILSFLIAIFFYPQMPEEVPSHWNAKGEVDDYLPKFWGSFLIPIMLLGIVIIFLAIPRIDPLKKNISQFKKHYHLFIIIFSLYMVLIQLQMSLWSIGTKISPNVVMPIGLAFLFYYIGILMEKSKRNWFIGIRTPWTLSSDKVWEKTHKIGGELFKYTAIIVLIGIFFHDYAVWFILVPVLFVAAFTIVYSYFIYQKVKK